MSKNTLQLPTSVYGVLNKINNNQQKFKTTLSKKINQSYRQINTKTIEPLTQLTEVESSKIKRIIDDLNHREVSRTLPSVENNSIGKSKQKKKKKNNNKESSNSISKFRNSHMNFETKKSIGQVKVSKQSSKLIPQYQLKKGNSLNVTNYNSLQKIVEIQNSEDRTLSNIIQRSIIRKKRSLINADEDIICKFLNQYGPLSQNSIPESYYEFFTILCQRIFIQIQNPLIKRYKNCIYFGENPASMEEKRLYEGFLYHFNLKIYFGQFLANKKHGRGTEINFDQFIISKGIFDSGNKVGKFLVFKKGIFQYQGQIRHGTFDGKGIMTTKESRYQGQFKNGMKYGKGRQTFFATRETYIGDYVDDYMDGIGQISKENYFYQGGFKKNLKHGHGYEKTNTQQYKGDFSKDKRQGKGILYFVNGYSYTGQFKNGLMHGRGQMQYQNNKTVIGFFENNKLIQLDQNRQSSQHFSNLIQRQLKNASFNNQEISQRQQQSIKNFEPRLAQTNPQRLSFYKVVPKSLYEQQSPLIKNHQKQKLISDEPSGIISSNNQKRKSSKLSERRSSKTNNNQFLKFDYSMTENEGQQDIPKFPQIKIDGQRF